MKNTDADKEEKKGTPSRATLRPQGELHARQRLVCLPNPCDTCPYRRDTPSGIWDAEEYNKLPKWDEPMAFAGTFLCHSSNKTALCRGWVEVHSDNMGVRLAMFQVEWNELNLKPTKVPLYRSGREAQRAGLAGIKRVSDEAKTAIQKITARRAQGGGILAWKSATA